MSSAQAIFIGLAVIVFLTGGSSRADVSLLLVLRPLCIVALGYALWKVRSDTLVAAWPLLAFIAVVSAIILVHLMPLPQTVWSLLPERKIVVEVDRVARFGTPWRPLTLSPSDTWNAFFSMVVPAAILVSMLRLTAPAKVGILPMLILAALVSGLLGGFQLIGGDAYFNPYGLTGEASASGLFTNRNHGAVFLGFVPPMMAAWASIDVPSVHDARFRRLAAILVSLAVIPMILITGSRAGLVAATIGFLAGIMLYRQPRALARSTGRRLPRLLVIVLVGLGAIGLATVTWLASRAQSFDRLLAWSGDDPRLGLWGPVLDIANRHFPFGSGFGSFERVYQIYEPASQLRTTYMNHAHNDWLEVYMTGGLAGLVLLAVASSGWAAMSYIVWRRFAASDRELVLARLGSVLILILGIASISDYPLRAPAMASVGVIAAVWLFDGWRHCSATKRRRG